VRPVRPDSALPWTERLHADGLAVRSLLSPRDSEARYTLAVTIHQFDANQYVRREATAAFGPALTERACCRGWVWLHRLADDG
jgi:hypothetical protein